MSKDKLFYSYLGAWNSNIIEYSKLFPNSILLHKRKKAIINNGLIYGGVGSLPIVYGYDHDVVGVWTGNSDDITEYTEGMSIIYVPGVEGSTNTTLNINGLGSHNILINNSNLVKQYKVGCPIILVYIKGVWRISDYYTNDVNLINETTSTSAYYLTMTNQKSGELYSYSNAKIYFQNNTLYSPRFNGSLTGNASSADKFSQGKKINGTTFDNTIDITTTYWGNERKFSISDNSSSYCGSYVLVHGDKDITIKLPSNIVAEKFFGSFIGPLSGNVTGNVTGNVSGNSSTATKLKNSHTLWGQTFNGTQDVSGNISNTGNIVPSEDLTYNIGLTTSRYNNIYASHLIGRADTVTSSKDNTTKIYFVGVTGANQALKFDENIYTSTTSGNLHSSRLYINTSTENINYRFYTTGDGYISGKLVVNGDDGITSKKFIKEGSNNTYVLLGGGGQLLLSELFSGDDVALYTGGSGNLTQNVAATNGNVHFTLKSKSTYYKHNLVGSNGIEITSDANGKITFKNTALLNQYTTGLFVGESSTKVNKSVTDPYLKLFDDNTLRNEYRFIGGSNVTITSDNDGNITIDSSYVNTDTHWTGNLRLGAKDTLTTAATTNGSTYLKFTENGSVRADQILIKGTGITTVSSDANGVLTINTNNPNTHYTTGFYIGESSTKANKSVIDPYLKLFDDNTLRGEHQLIGGSNVNITSDANGNITIDSFYVNTDTHWTGNLRLGAKDTLTTAATSNGSTYLKFTENGSVRTDQILIKGTGCVSVSSDANGVLTINGVDTNTHYTTSLYIGESTTKANKNITNPYLKLFDNNSLRNQYQVKGGSNVTITSDANGNITIDSTYNDTHWTSNLYVGTKDTKTNAASSTNGGTWLKLVENNNIRTTQVNLVGTGIATVTNDASGKISINVPNTNSHYATGFFVGESTTKSNKAITNPYLKIFDDNTLRGEHQLIGGSNVTITSDANGHITIDSSYVNTDTHWTGNLRLGSKDTLTTAATSNGSTYLKFTENGSVRADQILIKGTGITTVSSDANGVLTINTNNPNTHFTTTLFVGEKDTKANKAITSPYIKLFDNNTLRSQYLITGGNDITVTSDANGNITIDNNYTAMGTFLPLAGGQMKGNITWKDSTALPENTTPEYFLTITSFASGGNTKWASKANTLKALTGLTSTAIGSSSTPIYWDGSKFVTSTAIHEATTGFYIGEATTKANKNITNPYLKIFDDNTLRNQYQIKGGSNVTVTSDSNGNITITSSYSDTHWTGNLHLGAKDTLTTAATSNGSTYLKFVENNTLRSNQILIKGTGCVSVSSDANGVLTINGVDTDTHYITSLYIGEATTKANKAITSPYIKIFDNNTLRNQYQFKGGTGISVASDASGNVTITNTAPDTDTKVNQSETTTSNWRGIVLGYNDNGNPNTGITSNVTNVVYTSNKLTFQPSTGNISTQGNIIFDSSHGIHQKQGDTSNYTAIAIWLKNGTGWYKSDGTTLYTYQPQIGQHNTGDTTGAITILPYATDTNAWSGSVGLYIGKTVLKWENKTILHSSNYTSYVDYYIYIGEANTNANKATTNPYIKLYNLSDKKSQHQVKGNNNITVTSDASGNITIQDTLTYLYVGASNTASHAAVTSNPYIKLYDGSTRRSEVQIKGSGGTTVSSDASGNITISSGTTSHTHQIKINGTTYTIPYTGAVDCGRYITASGFANGGSTSLSSWGTLTTSNGYTGVLNINDPDGGSWEIAYKGGKQFHQIDGYYYQNEGRYRVTDVTETVTALGTSGNYITWTKNGSTNNLLVPYATNADTLDGIHASGLFTNFSNAGSQTTSITIGGTNKTLKIDADLLDGHHGSYYHIHTARSYTSVDAMPSGSEGWYNIFTLSDSTDGAVICTIKAYAHSSITFIASKGYSTTATLQILQYNSSGNGSYFYVKGVRIVDGGKVQALFNKTSGVSSYISVSINIFSSHGTLRPNATLTLETGTPTVIAGPLTGTHGKITSNIVGDITGHANSANNADTVDNYHASGLFELFQNVGSQTTRIKIGGNQKDLKIDADLLDGVHASGLFTAFGNSGNNITATIGGTVKTFTVNYATNSTSSEYLNNYTISDPNAAKKDNKVKWFAQINSSSGYAGNNYGFPVSNNANGILYLGTHPGEYGHQLGFSSNGSIYRRYQNGSAFPTTANGGSWLRILDSGNSSVSGGGSSFGSSITVTINGITKTLTIPSNPNSDYRVTQNSDSTNTEYRLLFKYSANDTNETTTVKYNTKFRYNPSTGNIFNNGNFYIDTGDNDRFIQFRYNSNNYAGASWRLISRGSGSGDTNYFDIETGGSGSSNNTWYRVIRLTMDNRYVGIGTDSPSSKLHVNGGLLKITNNSNTVTIGSANSSWCHFENSADIPFYFNKAVHVNGDIRLYNGTAWIQSSNGHMYANGFHHRSINNDNYVLLAGGSYKEWNAGYKVSTIVARNASGQIYCSHLNTTSNDMNSTSFTKVFVSNDNWIRYVTKSKFVEALNAEDTVSFTKSLKVTQNWMDADIAVTTTNFPKGNGAYAVLIDATSLSDSTDLWPSIYSGIMTIYTSGTNSTGSDEVILHRAGHASAKRLYLRTTQNNSGNYKIQVAASNDFSTTKSLVFKFRKLI